MNPEPNPRRYVVYVEGTPNALTFQTTGGDAAAEAYAREHFKPPFYLYEVVSAERQVLVVTEEGA